LEKQECVKRFAPAAEALQEQSAEQTLTHAEARA